MHLYVADVNVQATLSSKHGLSGLPTKHTSSILISVKKESTYTHS
jgi:hypothetical protein